MVPASGHRRTSLPDGEKAGLQVEDAKIYMKKQMPGAGAWVRGKALNSVVHSAQFESCLFLQVEDATDYVNQQVEDAQRQMEEARLHAQESLEQYQKVRAWQ